jgi:hypothetical protein
MSGITRLEFNEGQSFQFTVPDDFSDEKIDDIVTDVVDAMRDETTVLVLPAGVELIFGPKTD